MRSCTLLVFLALAWGWPLAAIAQVADTVAASPPMEPMGSVSSMVARLVVTLGLILVVIFATVWFLRRIMAKRWPGNVSTRPIRVLDRVHLAPKRSLDVIAVGERVLLLGVTESGINFLTELSAEEKDQFETPPPQHAGFKRILGDAKDHLRQTFNKTRTQLQGAAVSAEVGAESK